MLVILVMKNSLNLSASFGCLVQGEIVALFPTK